jgi:uncharacterized cupredoxin-like copper-binding protein
MRQTKSTMMLVAAAVLAAASFGPAYPAGDLSRQEPIAITVELGKPGQHVFVPSKLRFETGKLYKLVLKNPSDDAHYFTSHAFTQLIYTRKVQVVQERDGKMTTLAEFKGAIREIEVYRRTRHGGRDRHRMSRCAAPTLPQERTSHRPGNLACARAWQPANRGGRATVKSRRRRGRTVRAAHNRQSDRTLP